MPGRGLRIREEIPNDMTRLVHSIAYAVHLHIDRPSIFFGHSMGALVAFETHRYLAAHALRSCDELFVSACPAPRFMTTETGRFAWQRNGEDLVERLRRLGGTSNELLQNKEFLDVILPPYRADLDILASYQYRPANPLSCALTILGGRDDTSVDASELNAWRSETQKAATSHFFAGGHFYVFERAAEVMNHLAARAPGGDGAPTSMH
jgi:medium-chain acyl-[acyl-carrier-protein] hydrolase